jgi:hypothetical protein
MKESPPGSEAPIQFRSSKLESSYWDLFPRTAQSMTEYDMGKRNRYTALDCGTEVKDLDCKIPDGMQHPRYHPN